MELWEEPGHGTAVQSAFAKSYQKGGPERDGFAKRKGCFVMGLKQATHCMSGFAVSFAF